MENSGNGSTPAHNNNNTGAPLSSQNTNGTSSAGNASATAPGGGLTPVSAGSDHFIHGEGANNTNTNSSRASAVLILLILTVLVSISVFLLYNAYLRLRRRRFGRSRIASISGRRRTLFKSDGGGSGGDSSSCQYSQLTQADNDSNGDNCCSIENSYNYSTNSNGNGCVSNHGNSRAGTGKKQCQIEYKTATLVVVDTDENSEPTFDWTTEQQKRHQQMALGNPENEASDEDLLQ